MNIQVMELRRVGNRTEIREINKSDLNKVFTDDFSIWQLDYYSNLNGVYVVTFEYDWYQT